MVDGEIESFRQGDVVLFSNISKRNIHRVLEDKIVYDMFDFYPSIFSGTKLWMPFFSGKHILVGAGDEDRQAVYTVLDRLKAEMLAPETTPFRTEAVKELINYLGVLFYRKCGNEAVPIPPSLYRIAESVQYLSEHLTEDLNLEKLAAYFGYSSEHFSRIFKKYTGLSPVRYLVHARIDNTLRLMQDEHITVLDAAFCSGFRNSSSFYKAFQAYKGMSPTKYLSAKPEHQELLNDHPTPLQSSLG